MNFSLMFFSSGEGVSAAASYQAILELARFGDAHGFQRLWFPERHFVRFGALHPNPATLAAAVATHTNRIRIGAGSVVAPLHDPIRIAEEWAVVDNLSGGRVDLAFASGWRAEDFALAPGNYSTRREILVSTISLVQKLWKGEPILREDGRSTTAEVRTFPRPVQRDLPIWVTAARNTGTFQLAGALGANVLCYLVDLGLEGLSDRISAYRRARAGAGLAGGEGRVTVMLHTYLGAGPAIRARAEEAYKRYLVENREVFVPPRNGATRPLSRNEAEQLAAAQFGHVFENLSLIGSIQACRRVVEHLETIGVDEIACLVDFVDDFAMAQEALPSIIKLREELEARPVAVASGEAAPAVSGQASDFYDYITGIGGSYGSAFRLVDQFTANEAQATCILQVEEARRQPFFRTTLTDAAISSAHAIGMTPGLRGCSCPLGLPIGIGRASFMGAQNDTLLVKTKLRESEPEAIRFDIEVVTKSGDPVLCLEKVTFQRSAVTSSDWTQEQAKAVTHGVAWETREKPESLFSGTDEGTDVRRRFVVEAETPELAELIDGFGKVRNCSVLSSRTEQMESAETESFAVLVAHPFREWQPGDVTSPRSAVERIGNWLQYWSSHRNVRLVILVSGANRVIDSDPAGDPVAAAAWAAAISVASGTLGRAMWIIDVDPILPLGEQTGLIVSLLSEAHPAAVALRAGHWYKPRIDRHSTTSRGKAPSLGSYALITGGSGALGRWLAQWLTEEGVSRLRVVSRNATRARPTLDLLKYRAEVEVINADLSVKKEAARVTQGLSQPFDTVFHLCGDVGDAHGAGLGTEIVDRCFKPKLDALINLAEALATHPPHRLVLFSSVAAVTGSAGQAAYAAANASMAAAAARHPALRNVTVQTVCFGPWAGPGMASGAGVERLLRAKGAGLLPPWLALRALGCFLASEHQVALIFARDSDQAVSVNNGKSLRQQRQRRPAIAALRSLPEEQRLQWLQSEIVRLTAETMEQDPASIDPRHNLYEIGFDSIMAIEVKNLVLRDYGVELSLASLIKSNTIAEIASNLLPALLEAPDQPTEELIL